MNLSVDKLVCQAGLDFIPDKLNPICKMYDKLNCGTLVFSIKMAN